MEHKVIFNDVSKKFQYHSIIKNFSYQFTSPSTYAILGSNGSGKSTLIRLLSGLHTPSSGNIEYHLGGKKCTIEQLPQQISLAAPWSDVIEDFTLRELISFHFKFRKPLNGMTEKEMIVLSGLEHAQNRFIHQYSSGMKQRVRLTIAFFTASAMLLLDEPTSNLDNKGKQWYNDLIKTYTQNRMVIVASNHLTEEYGFCTETIEIGG